MMITSLLLSITSNSVAEDKSKSMIYCRFTMQTLLLICFVLYNNLFIKYLREVLDIYGGISNVNNFTQSFNLLIIIIILIIPFIINTMYIIYNLSVKTDTINRYNNTLYKFNIYSLLNSPPKPHPFVNLALQSNVIKVNGNTLIKKIFTYINYSSFIQSCFIKIHLSLYLLLAVLYPVRHIIMEYSSINPFFIYAITGGVSYAIVSLIISLVIPVSYNLLHKENIVINKKYIISYILKLSITGFFVSCFIYTTTNVFLLYICGYHNILVDIYFTWGLLNFIDTSSIKKEIFTLMDGGNNSQGGSGGGPSGSDGGPTGPGGGPSGPGGGVPDGFAATGDPMRDHNNPGNFSVGNTIRATNNIPIEDRTSFGRGGGRTGPIEGPWYDIPWTREHIRFHKIDIKWDSKPLLEDGEPNTNFSWVPGIPDGFRGQITNYTLANYSSLQTINAAVEPFVKLQVNNGLYTVFFTSVERHLEVVRFIVWFRNQLALVEYHNRAQLFGSIPYTYDLNYWNSKLDEIERKSWIRDQFLKGQYATLKSNMSPLKQAILQNKLGSWGRN